MIQNGPKCRNKPKLSKIDHFQERNFLLQLLICSWFKNRSSLSRLSLSLHQAEWSRAWVQSLSQLYFLFLLLLKNPLSSHFFFFAKVPLSNLYPTNPLSNSNPKNPPTNSSPTNLFSNPLLESNPKNPLLSRIPINPLYNLIPQNSINPLSKPSPLKSL